MNPNQGLYGTSSSFFRDAVKAVAPEHRAGVIIGAGRATKITMDGKPSLRVGNGSSKAVVYAPTCEQEAQRNLNFARANLAAYTGWLDEAPARAKAELEAKNRKDYERRGLEAYNMQANSKHSSWSAVFWPRLEDKTVVDAWVKLVKDIAASYMTMPGARVRL